MRTLFFIFHGVCHQMSGRSLSCDYFSMPLCSRCAGLYTGFFLALGPFLLLALKKKYTFSRAFAVPAVVAALIWAADGAANFLQIYDTPNFLRFASGLLFALSLSPVIASLFTDTLAQRIPTARLRRGAFGALAITALALTAANYRPPAALLVAESFAAAAGLVMLVMLAHAAILMLIFTRRRPGLAVALALVTATTQVVVLSTLRNLLGL